MPVVDFPSVAQVQIQSYVGGLLGRPVKDSEITSFTSRARKLQPKLTERAALVLFALSKLSAPIIAKHLPLAHSLLWVVLPALHDLGLVEIAGERWRATAELTDAGKRLADEAAHHG